MELKDILVKFEPLFNYEIKKFYFLGIPKDDIKSEIFSVVLRVSRMNLEEEEVGKYLKAAIENNLRRILLKERRLVLNNEMISFTKKFDNITSILKEADSERLNGVERFVYILKRSGLKRMEIAKILKKSDSYVKVILRNIKKKMEVRV